MCASRLRTIATPRCRLACARVVSLPAYPASAQASVMRRQALRRFHSSTRAASRSWTEAAVTRMVSSSPVVSTAMWRLRPLTFLAWSQPRLAFGTVSAARMD